MYRWLVVVATIAVTVPQVYSNGSEIEPAVRVVRIQIDYPNAAVSSTSDYPNWNHILRNSVLASLRFVNKHWLLCGETKFDM
ncbi:unnamed protein product [Enterobius vermicularis]|uniref:Secreted protein n=1 Tax=Enterobius vermicularis TaxID=51028 RepID=A0A0N4VQW7_ENTVE|nr:unnamed protein product [Enterobius vermicularis]